MGGGRSGVPWYGTIIHGEEFQDPLRRCIPTTYYSPQSGVGLALASLEAAGAVRMGVIGLGVGTLAAYARPREFIRFYEINPLVPVIASRDFGYLDLLRRHLEPAARRWPPRPRSRARSAVRPSGDRCFFGRCHPRSISSHSRRFGCISGILREVA